MSEYFEEDHAQGLEPGAYTSTLAAIDDVVVTPFKDQKSGTDNGERWQFGWDVATAEGIVRLNQLTTRKLNNFPTNAWRVLTALGYRGGKVSRSDFIGKRCMITLGLKDNGWNTFEAFSPIRAEPEPQLKLRLEIPSPDSGGPSSEWSDEEPDEFADAS